jgi:hypothetical protein
MSNTLAVTCAAARDATTQIACSLTQAVCVRGTERRLLLEYSMEQGLTHWLAAAVLVVAVVVDDEEGAYEIRGN